MNIFNLRRMAQHWVFFCNGGESGGSSASANENDNGGTSAGIGFSDDGPSANENDNGGTSTGTGSAGPSAEQQNALDNAIGLIDSGMPGQQAVAQATGQNFAPVSDAVPTPVQNNNPISSLVGRAVNFGLAATPFGKANAIAGLLGLPTAGGFVANSMNNPGAPQGADYNSYQANAESPGSVEQDTGLLGSATSPAAAPVAASQTPVNYGLYGSLGRGAWTTAAKKFATNQKWV